MTLSITSYIGTASQNTAWPKKQVHLRPVGDISTRQEPPKGGSFAIYMIKRQVDISFISGQQIGRRGLFQRRFIRPAVALSTARAQQPISHAPKCFAAAQSYVRTCRAHHRCGAQSLPVNNRTAIDKCPVRHGIIVQTAPSRSYVSP